MALAKVIEVIGEGTSVENAIENIAAESSQSLRDVRSIYVDGIKAWVQDGKVQNYRVNAKVTFVLDADDEG